MPTKFLKWWFSVDHEQQYAKENGDIIVLGVNLSC